LPASDPACCACTREFFLGKGLEEALVDAQFSPKRPELSRRLCLRDGYETDDRTLAMADYDFFAVARSPDET